MSYSTSVYIYSPRQQIVLFGGNSARRYEIVYAKNLTLNKGVLNTLQFQFVNQQQKPVDITGTEVTCRVMDNTGTKVLLQKALTITLALTGLAELIVQADEIQTIDAQAGYYSLEFKSDPTSIDPGKPVFVNSEAAVRGVMNIVNSVLPAFVASRVVTIPTYDLPVQSQNTNYTASSNPQQFPFYSSQFPNSGPLTMIQAEFENFNGQVQLQGSTVGVDGLQNPWYNIGNTMTYVSQYGAAIYPVEGYHPWLRLQFSNIAEANYNPGSIVKLLVR